MKQLLLFALASLLLTNCSKNNTAFIKHITGYWEIQSVTLADGNTKEYSTNQSIDYISINDSLKGFRKKMSPLFNGKYEMSKHTETLHLKIENDSLNIYYLTKQANWKETVLMASETQLQIINQDKNLYLYKRFTPIIIE